MTSGKLQQIEEMAKATMKHCKIGNQCGSCQWSTCNECLSEVLYNAGYRKSSEVASNVIDEFIEKVCEKYDIWTEADEREYHYMLNLMEITKDELKKKYTEEPGNG